MSTTADRPKTSATDPLVSIRVDSAVAYVTLNRPDKRNALSLAMLQSLSEALTDATADPAVRVIVLAAEGKVFSSGHDLTEMAGRPESDYRKIFEACTEVMLKLRRLPVPVIARVHALATAAGCQLVAACDLAVASETAAFATPGVKIGLFCSTPMVPLVRAIPAKPAMEMLLTGRPISAQRALELGLVNAVVPAEELDATVAKLTAEIAAVSPAVVAAGKRAFYEQQSLPEELAYTQAVEAMVTGACHADAQEGITAFLQKRTPTWQERQQP